MENLRSQTLAFFMSLYGSLESWDITGTLQKEMRIYTELANSFSKIIIFSYGKNDALYNGKFAKNIIILPRPKYIPPVLYEFLLPILHWKILKSCNLLKTNQNSGAFAPSLLKIFSPRKKFVVRSGYIGSEFARLSKMSFFARCYFSVVENISYRLCDRAFIPENDLPTLVKKYPFLEHKLTGLNNAINTDLFKKIDVPKQYDIVYQARLDTVQKNHQGLLEAVEGLSLKLLFIGKGSEKDRILAEAKKRNIDLTLLERVPNEELPAHYNSAKICAFPSFFEGNPKALLECMSCELPVVAFSVTGVKNLIEDKKSGLLSAPDNNLLRENIQHMLSDTSFQTQCGKNARAFILTHYAFEKLFEKELSRYKKLFAHS